MASLALAGSCPYALLGILPHASPEDVASAYRRLAVTSHPDKGGTPWIFRQQTEAYNVLKNADHRSLYDLRSHLGVKIALTAVDKQNEYEVKQRIVAEENSRSLSQIQLSSQGPQAKAKAKAEPRQETNADYAERVRREYQSWQREETRKKELREEERKELCEKARAELVAKEQAAREEKSVQRTIAQSKKRSRKNFTLDKAEQEAMVQVAFKAVMKQLNGRSCLLERLSVTESSKAECESQIKMLRRKVLACEELDATTKPSDRNKQQKEKIQRWKGFRDDLSKCKDLLLKCEGDLEDISENLRQFTASVGQPTPHERSQASQ